MKEIDNEISLIAYQNVIQAIDHLNSLRASIRTARDGCGCSIPTNTDQYTAKIHQWLIAEKETLEQELFVLRKG